MARNNQNVSYTPDAFDEPPEGPVGVHRGNLAWYSILLPYVAVLVSAAVAGFIVWAVLSGEISHLPLPWNHTQQISQQKTVKKTDAEKPKDDEDDDDSADADTNSSDNSQADSSTKASKKDADSANKKDTGNTKDTAATQSSSQAPIDKSVAVRVINATNITGHAAQSANKLKQNGYTNVTAANPTGKVPTNSVVWYKDESQRAAAQDIAKALGISAVESSQDIVMPVVVVLCK